MKVLRGNRTKGFTELLDTPLAGGAFHRIVMDSEAGSNGPVPVLLLDVGDDELLQVRLSEDEVALLKLCMKSEGMWVYPQDEEVGKVPFSPAPHATDAE